VIVRLLVADQRSLLRRALAEALTAGHDLDIVASTGDVPSTVLQAARVGAQVVLLPAVWADHLAELCEQLHALDVPPRTLLLDGQGDENILLHAIESGIDGYVTGASGLAGVADAIHALARGESVVPPTMLGPLLRRLIQRQREADQVADRLVALTPREREVLALLTEGRDHASIAGVLCISPETARTHVQRLLRKLDVHSRTEAIALVRQAGLAARLERLVERNAS
jgi:DNA-binding NarL/FixJ family response regulator